MPGEEGASGSAPCSVSGFATAATRPATASAAPSIAARTLAAKSSACSCEPRRPSGRARRGAFGARLRVRRLSSSRRLGRARVQGQQAPDLAAQLGAPDDAVDEAVLELELGALEAGGQLAVDGLLDDARAGEGHERAGLGQDHVPLHGEATR